METVLYRISDNSDDNNDDDDNHVIERYDKSRILLLVLLGQFFPVSFRFVLIFRVRYTHLDLVFESFSQRDAEGHSVRNILFIYLVNCSVWI